MKLRIRTELLNPDTGESEGFETPKTIYDSQTGEPMVVDEIEIDDIRWNRTKGRVFCVYVLGGRNSAGEFIPDATQMKLPYVFYRDKHTQAIWARYNLNQGATDPDTIKRMLMDEPPAINTVARCNWIKREELRTKRFFAELIEE